MLAVLEIIGRRQDSPASCRARKRKCKIIKIVVDFRCLLWYIIGMNKTHVISTVIRKFVELGYSADNLKISVGTCRRGAAGTFHESCYLMVKKGISDPGIRTYFPPRIVIDSRCPGRDFVATLEHELGHYVEHLQGANEKTGYSESFADSFIGRIA